jgi:hypothetical protein
VRDALTRASTKEVETMILIELVFDVAPDIRDDVLALARRTTEATHQEREVRDQEEGVSDSWS